MRPFRFVIHMRECGWEPTVLTIAAQGQHLTDKEARLLEGVEIVELTPPFDRTVQAESQLGLADARKKERTRSSSRNSSGRGGARPWFSLEHLDRQFPVDTWLLLFLLKYRRITQVVRRVRPHVIWSTGDPWSSLVIAGRLARRFGIPYVADFRDPWTLSNIRTEGQWHITKTIDRYCERRVLEAADAVLFQARQIEKRYREHYADLDLNTTTIYNSYDPAVFEDPVCLDRPAAGAAALVESLDIGFFGRFREMSPASLMADVVEEARRRHGALADHIHVYSFGPLNDADVRYAEKKGVRENFRRHEAVPLERALSALRQFDLLLLSTDPRRNGIIPAKLLEYLAAGRPVLSLSRNPEVAQILERTGTGLQVSLERKEDIADLLIESLKAKREGRSLPVPFEPQPDAIRRFEARPTTQELADLFASVQKPFGC